MEMEMEMEKMEMEKLELEKLKKKERIKESKREYARKSREKAKLEGKMTKSDEKKEKLRVIKQTIAGGDTHIEKIKALKIDLEVLTEYCDHNKCNLNKVKQYIMEILQKNIKKDNEENKYDEIFTLEKFLLNTKSIYTAKSYLSHINSIKKILNINSNIQFINEIINKPSEICEKINKQYKENTMTYIAPIIFIIQKFDEIKIMVNNEIISIYKDKLNEYKQIYTYVKMNKNDGIMAWDQIVKLRTQIEDKYKYGIYHLLISLYTLIPPMRDDFGLVKIIINDNLLNTNDNFYVTDTHTFHFNQYKTIKKYKKLVFKVPKALHDIIIESLKLNPRQYLITQNINKSDKPYKNGKLTAIFPRIFKIDKNTHLNINDFRHAFETYIGQFGIDFKLEEKILINRIIGHDSNQRDFYIRDLIRSKPVFKKNYEKTEDIIQCISNKIGGFYISGDQIKPYQPIQTKKKLKLKLKLIAK